MQHDLPGTLRPEHFVDPDVRQEVSAQALAYEGDETPSSERMAKRPRLTNEPPNWHDLAGAIHGVLNLPTDRQIGEFWGDISYVSGASLPLRLL